MVAEPAVIAVTLPAEDTVATSGADEDHVPPPVAWESTLPLPSQATIVPDMAAGAGLDVMVITDVQLVEPNV